MILKNASKAIPKKISLGNDLAAGLGLAELLIVSAIGGLLAIVLAQFYSGFARERAKLEMYQKAVNNWERISRMIETDVTESRLVVDGNTSCAGATSSFDLYVNKLGNSSSTSYAVISYSLVDGNLYRCGPPVCSTFADCPGVGGVIPLAVDGRLDFTASRSSTALVAVGISFATGKPSVMANGSLDYGFIFTGLNGSKAAEFASRARPSSKWINQCAFATATSC